MPKRLALWVTNGKINNIPVIQHGLNLLETWGFKYHTLLTWVKPQGISFSSPIRGMTEHIIFAWRGNFHNLTNKQCAVMNSKIVTHTQLVSAQKPTQFYQKLRGWTPEPRIDLFARQVHYGFDGWGDEYVGEGPLQEFLE